MNNIDWAQNITRLFALNAIGKNQREALMLVDLSLCVKQFSNSRSTHYPGLKIRTMKNSSKKDVTPMLTQNQKKQKDEELELTSLNGKLMNLKRLSSKF